MRVQSLVALGRNRLVYMGQKGRSFLRTTRARTAKLAKSSKTKPIRRMKFRELSRSPSADVHPKTARLLVLACLRKRNEDETRPVAATKDVKKGQHRHSPCD